MPYQVQRRRYARPVSRRYGATYGTSLAARYGSRYVANLAKNKWKNYWKNSRRSGSGTKKSFWKAANYAAVRRFKSTRYNKGGRTAAVYRKINSMIGVGSVAWRTSLKTIALEYNIPIGKRTFDPFGDETVVNGINRKNKMSEIIIDAIANQGMSADVDAKLVVKTQSSSITMKNESNATAYVTLLVVQCHKALPQGTTWNDVIKKGFENQGLLDSLDQDQATHLKDNTKFKQYLHVTWSKKYQLQAGQEATKTIWDNTPKKWSKNKYILDDSEVDAGQYAEMRGAQFFMTIVNGQLCFDSTTTTNIGFAPIVMDYLFTNRVMYAVANSQTKTAFETTTTTIPVTPTTRINSNIDKVLVD